MRLGSLIRTTLRPRNIALGLAVTSPFIYMIAFANDNEGNPKQARYWQVRAYQLFPLRFASRLWGSVNSVTLPVWFRPYGFRVYSWIFGVDLSEIADPDLKNYANLGDFFYRRLKSDARPIANGLMVSPCDGKVLQFGQLKENSHIEQVKGISYTVDSLLGDSPENLPLDDTKSSAGISDLETVAKEPRQVQVNGVEYTVTENPEETKKSQQKMGEIEDATDRTKGVLESPFWLPRANTDNRLYYCVIYLAPGDYHRFHSPVPWVVTLRRHFHGELFSVAPYFQNRLANLFCLNERVALLGMWKHGFFSMTPVGATNVGSIIVNFDKHLKTNSKGSKRNTCDEANYQSASPFYGGFPLNKGEEMGGFRLGSTIVLVFEAPENFNFAVKLNSVVKMGELLGDIQ